MEKNSKTGIFLSGGGGIGAFHIGFFKAMKEAGLKYDLVVGGSVGTMVGGGATYMTPDEMIEAWNHLTLESVLKVDSRKIANLSGVKRNLMLIKECFLSCARRDPHLMIDVEDIRKQLYELLDGDKIMNSPIDFGITTSELPSFRRVDVFKEDMITNPLEYILASIYMPIFSRQKMIDNKSYIDLSRFRSYPLEMLKQKKCDNVIIVNIELEHTKRLMKQIETTFNSGEDVTYINYETKPSILDFSREQSDINYKCGYETTMRVFDKKL